MGKRLAPGEAERRAAERHRATFSGEKYKRYDPATEGFGSFEEWASIAAAFVNGDVSFLDEARNFEAETATGPKKKKNPNPHLAALDLDEMPTDVKVLTAGYRKAVMAAFRAAACSDTSPAYVAAFKTITQAYDRIKMLKGW